MCVGLPMQIIEPRGRYALCRYGEDVRTVDMVLVGEQPAGAWVLVFLDAAREIMTAEQAEKTADAMRALALVMQGETSVDHFVRRPCRAGTRTSPHLKSLLPKPAE